MAEAVAERPAETAPEPPQHTPERPGKQSLRARLRERAGLLIGGALVVILVVVALWYRAAGRETTDDAQIDGHVSPVAAKVAGTVSAVYATDNQIVTEGTVASYIYNRHIYYRRTGSHAGAEPLAGGSQHRTADGTYLNGNAIGGSINYPKLLALLRAEGQADQLVGVELESGRPDPGALAAILFALNQYIASHSAGEAFPALR